MINSIFLCHTKRIKLAKTMTDISDVARRGPEKDVPIMIPEEKWGLVWEKGGFYHDHRRDNFASIDYGHWHFHYHICTFSLPQSSQIMRILTSQSLEAKSIDITNTGNPKTPNTDYNNTQNEAPKILLKLLSSQSVDCDSFPLCLIQSLFIHSWR